MSAAIGVFTKAPIAGKTKTRLARVIGDEAAAALHVAFLWDTLSAASQVAECVLFSAGQHDHPALAQVTKHFGLRQMHQDGHDLGERMTRAIIALLKNRTPAVLIGSDAPTIPGRVLQAACVSGLSFGPSSDGGFYLVGATSPPDFAGIAWSKPTTLRDTLTKNPGAVLLESWFDVDELDDLRTLQTQLALEPEAAPKTSQWLAAHSSVFSTADGD